MDPIKNKKHIPFVIAVGIVLFYITWQLCLKIIPLLNGTTDSEFKKGLAIFILCGIAWILYFLLSECWFREKK